MLKCVSLSTMVTRITQKNSHSLQGFRIVITAVQNFNPHLHFAIFAIIIITSTPVIQTGVYLLMPIAVTTKFK